MTAEGLGPPDALHPVQHELAVRGGSQCGYCTPGFVCSMAAEYYRDDREPDGRPPTASTAPTASTCTRSAATCAAAPATARSATPPYALGTPGRRRRRSPPGCAARPPTPRPPASTGASGVFARRRRPRATPCALLAEHPDAVLVAGSTDWGVEVNLRGARAPSSSASTGSRSCATLRRGRRRRRDRRGTEPQRDRARLWRAGSRCWTSCSRSSPPGSSATARPSVATSPPRSPIGDAAPALLALDASVVLASVAGDREVPLADYFTGYRQTRAPARRAHPCGADPLAAQRDHGIPQDRQAPLRRHLQRRRRLRPRRARRRGRTRPDRPRRRRGHPRAGARHRGGARGSAVDRRDRAAAAEVLRDGGDARSTTTGPARPTARRCSAPPCCGSMRRDATSREVRA